MSRSFAAADAFDTILDAIPPASGAVVMGTGIVSVALSLDGQETLSRLLLALDAAVWAILAILLPARAARDRELASAATCAPPPPSPRSRGRRCSAPAWFCWAGTGPVALCW